MAGVTWIIWVMLLKPRMMVDARLLNVTGASLPSPGPVTCAPPQPRASYFTPSGGSPRLGMQWYADCTHRLLTQGRVILTPWTWRSLLSSLNASFRLCSTFSRSINLPSSIPYINSLTSLFLALFAFLAFLTFLLPSTRNGPVKNMYMYVDWNDRSMSITFHTFVAIA
ncbi:hypothetical protein K505DRAFT_106743 [Melanomma pulvis-pyrius CBS 109.77]|uniref:Uncharacterized protein n=1 Tax=Melanomma pulvis-pyrius CBS 109.77 TaxID=1314802 RepID=A0A6A6XPQ2_9PLEO|nr:hypothetical protein K505DRAFT_106743 [Melanomma pulvis-pyrius CBS 109.77]